MRGLLKFISDFEDYYFDEILELIINRDDDALSELETLMRICPKMFLDSIFEKRLTLTEI